MSAGTRIEEAIRRRNEAGEPALAPFVTAGYPTMEGFGALLERVESEADVVEIGVPFSDPMADGVTIQRSSRTALENGVHLDWILSTLTEQLSSTPRVLMSYYNPLLAFGLEALAERLPGAGVDALIIPDLPFEEQGEIRSALFDARVGLVQLVTPVTPEARRRSLAEASTGFLYAVTVAGTTGGARSEGGSETLSDYLSALVEESRLPVLAGFGVRSAEQLAAIGRVAAGAVVGSALIEALEADGDPADFLRTLRYGAPRTETHEPRPTPEVTS